MEFKTKRFRSFDDSIFLTFMLFSDDRIFFWHNYDIALPEVFPPHEKHVFRAQPC